MSQKLVRLWTYLEEQISLSLEQHGLWANRHSNLTAQAAFLKSMEERYFSLQTHTISLVIIITRLIGIRSGGDSSGKCNSINFYSNLFGFVCNIDVVT